MKQIINMDVPLGNRIIEKKENLQVWEAEKILTSRKQRYYTKAVRSGVDVELSGTYIKCPFCGKEYTFNTKYPNCKNTRKHKHQRVSKDVVYNWSCLQLSFFEESKENTLEISSPLDSKFFLKCSECERVSGESDSARQVTMAILGNKIIIKSEISDLGEIFSLRWNSQELVSLSFPMYEVLTFNFKKGRVYVKLEDCNGSILCQRDVSTNPELLRDSVSLNLISNYKGVNRNLKRLFRNAWGSELPYCGQKISIEKLYDMTMFVGYNKNFYSAIPYKFGSMEVDNSFNKNVRKMRNARNIVTMFENSKLPKVKSVRRIFYHDPALFFYLDEAEMLWEAINDLNLFCEFMERYNIYSILADIHMRPAVMEYINDYCKERTPHKFVKNMAHKWQEVLFAAVDYSCSNPSVKKAIRESWKEKKNILKLERHKPQYALPMQSPEENIKDCTIDGYDFFWLRNSNDYEMAGRKLDNCLTFWNLSNGPVVCVKRKEKYVAAIEISDGLIVQARGHGNSSIEHDKKLYSAYLKWQERYKLETDSLYDDEDFDFLHMFD